MEPEIPWKKFVEQMGFSLEWKAEGVTDGKSWGTVIGVMQDELNQESEQDEVIDGTKEEADSTTGKAMAMHRIGLPKTAVDDL